MQGIEEVIGCGCPVMFLGVEPPRRQTSVPGQGDFPFRHYPGDLRPHVCMTRPEQDEYYAQQPPCSSHNYPPPDDVHPKSETAIIRPTSAMSRLPPTAARACKLPVEGLS